MLIYIGADHRGFNLKEVLKKYLKDNGYEVVDVGAASYNQSDDYPDYSAAVALRVSQNPSASRGIIVCGSGVGADIVANKFPKVRSSLVVSPDQAFMARNDDDANILTLPAEFVDENLGRMIVASWMQTSFSGEERHKRRVQKISEIENYIRTANLY